LGVTLDELAPTLRSIFTSVWQISPKDFRMEEKSDFQKGGGAFKMTHITNFVVGISMVPHGYYLIWSGCYIRFWKKTNNTNRMWFRFNFKTAL